MAAVETPPPLHTATPTARWWLLLGVCAAAAAATLALSRQTTYDPTAWLIWGREIVHGDLSTTYGPSWKPLPVLVTAPAALLGDSAQQAIWLVVARAAGLVAVALAARLAWRLGGYVAAVIAACALVLSSSFASHVLRGNSEGLLAALALGAIEAHLSGRRWLAFAALVATGLLRPEMWLLVVGYGVLLVSQAPRDGSSRRIAWLLAATVAAGFAAWTVPEAIGSGQLLRAASRAREPVAGSPAQAAHPFFATFTNAAPAVPWPIYVGAVALVLAALLAVRRCGITLALWLAGIATTLMVVVALMTEAGFTGNARYLTVPIALVCVLGGGGWALGVRAARSRLPASGAIAAIVIAAAISAPFVVAAAGRLHDELRAAMAESRAYAALPAAIARAGGRDALLSCAPLYTAATDTQAVARDLHLHQSAVGINPRPPGTVVARAGSSLARDPRFRTFSRTPRWVLTRSC